MPEREEITFSKLAGLAAMDIVKSPIGVLAGAALALVAGVAMGRAEGDNSKQDSAAELCLVEEAAKSDDWAERTMAAAALGKVKTPEAIPILLNLLFDRDGDVRKTAAESLEKHKPRDIRDVKALGKLRDYWEKMGYSLKPLQKLQGVWGRKLQNGVPVGDLGWRRPAMPKMPVLKMVPQKLARSRC